MAPWILPKNEHPGNFVYWKLSRSSFVGRIQDTIICFWDLLTFSRWSNAQNSWLVGDCIQHRRNGCIYMYNRMTWTNNAKLKEFKWQYVGHAVQKQFAEVISTTSLSYCALWPTCSHLNSLHFALFIQVIFLYSYMPTYTPMLNEITRKPSVSRWSQSYFF